MKNVIDDIDSVLRDNHTTELDAIMTSVFCGYEGETQHDTSFDFSSGRMGFSNSAHAQVCNSMHDEFACHVPDKIDFFAAYGLLTQCCIQSYLIGLNGGTIAFLREQEWFLDYDGWIACGMVDTKIGYSIEELENMWLSGRDEASKIRWEA